MRILVQPTTDGRGRLTGAEYDNVASNDDTLAIAKVSTIPCLVQQWDHCSSLQANWEKLADSPYHHQTPNREVDQPTA